jgi:hypothetical protein
MKARHFRDFYGCTACLSQTKDGRFRLTVSACNGHRFCNRIYDTYKGARCAMGRMGDEWSEV